MDNIFLPLDIFILKYCRALWTQLRSLACHSCGHIKGKREPNKPGRAVSKRFHTERGFPPLCPTQRPHDHGFRAQCQSPCALDGPATRRLSEVCPLVAPVCSSRCRHMPRLHSVLSRPWTRNQWRISDPCSGSIRCATCEVAGSRLPHHAPANYTHVCVCTAVPTTPHPVPC